MMLKLFKTYFVFTVFFAVHSSLYAQELPVLAFHGVQTEYTSEASFRKLKEAGININLTTYNTNDEAEKALDCALLAGVKILLYTEELVHNPKETVLRFKNHPALFGYYMGDEPDTSRFNILRDRIEEIRKYDTQHPCYINLFPNYADSQQLKATSYIDYLAKFINVVPVDFISFDNYPLMNNKIHIDWYQNLEMIRNISILSKKDFWGFANATVFGPYKQPTIAGIKLQMYSNLLYGAQGIQYFTYWTVDDEHWKKNGFGYAMVDAKGLPTPTYNVVKSANKDIQNYSEVFYGSKVVSVYHTTQDLPKDTKLLPAIPQKFKIFSADKPALVSYLKNGNENYIVVLNKDINQNMKLIVQPDILLNVLDKNGKKKRISSSKNTITIKPGDIAVFNF